MSGKSAAVLIVGVLGLAAAQHAVAGKAPDKGGGLDRTPVSCVWLSNVRKTEVVNDKTIVFYMYSGKVYRNTLRTRCFDLAHADAFSYKVTVPQLCRSDMIVPFDVDNAFPQLPCPLGRFVPIDRLEAKQMLAGPKDALAQLNEVQVKQVVLPPDDAGKPAQAAHSASPAGSAAASAEDAKTPAPAPASVPAQAPAQAD